MPIEWTAEGTVVTPPPAVCPTFAAIDQQGDPFGDLVVETCIDKYDNA